MPAIDWKSKETDFKRVTRPAGKDVKNGSLKFYWECKVCKVEYGPSSGTAIFKSERSKCCQRRYDEKSNYKGFRLITGSKMTQYKDSARRRGLVFEIDAEYLWSVWEAQKGQCAYTGLPIELNRDASLDRIDSSRGYVKGNVHWVMWKINRMKLNIPHEEFIQLCSLVSSRNGEQ